MNKMQINKILIRVVTFKCLTEISSGTSENLEVFCRVLSDLFANSANLPCRSISGESRLFGPINGAPQF